jgi:GNAT superfamily N-acetyltransferase
MSDFIVSLEQHPSPAEIRWLSDRLSAFNYSKTGHSDGKTLALFLKSKAGQMAGGFYGWTWGGWLQVDFLFVREDLRGRGFGRWMMLAAETEATNRACTNAVLDTFSFQALGFYQRMGYQIFAELENFPGNHIRYYLKKKLKPL